MNKCGRMGKGKFVLIPVFILAFVAVKSAAVMFLWNYLVPDLFHGPEVTYVQALCLVVLAKLLVGFGGPRGGGFGRGGWGRKWKNMSEEDRAKLRAKFDEKFAGDV